MNIQARYIGKSSFFEKGKVYKLDLTEEIRPKHNNKLLYHLEIFNELPQGIEPQEQIKMTYFGIEALLSSWEEISLKKFEKLPF